MSPRLSLALVSGALAFIAIWGVALASVDGGSLSVGLDGYGVYLPKKL